MADYREEILQKLRQYTGKNQELVTAYCDLAEATYSNRSQCQTRVTDLLFDGAKTMEDVLNRGARELLQLALPAVLADKLCRAILRLPLYMYNVTIYRRSSRSVKPSAYSRQLLNIFTCVQKDFTSFDLVEYLRMTPDMRKEANMPAMPGDVVSFLIGQEIDEGNQKIIDTVKEAVLSEQNTVLLERQLIRGVACSGNDELHLLMRDLLLAAKLQEGLRQTILESADEGTLKYFQLMVKTVLDNDLLRYSAAIRAVGVWMGLGYGFEDRRQVEKVLRLAHAYYQDETARKKAMDSMDALEIYAAMWAESLYGVEQTQHYIEVFMKGEAYKKLIAFYFVHAIGQKDYAFRIACRHLDPEADLDLLSFIIQAYALPTPWARDREEYLQRAKNNAKGYLDDEAERQELFDKLCAVLVRIPKDGHQTNSKPFPWSFCQLTRNQLYHQLALINGYCENEAMTKKLIQMSDYFTGDNKIALLNYFVDANRSREERKFLFASLSDRSIPVRTCAATHIKKHITLTDDEVQDVEKLLAMKTGDIRQLTVDILKSREETQILDSIRRLLADKSDNKRLGGLDLLAHMAEQQAVDKAQTAELIALMPKITEREKVLTNQLTAVEEQAKYTLKNGFGLYNPDYRPSLPKPEVDSRYTLERFRRIGEPEIHSLYESLRQLVETHKDYTYNRRNWDGSYQEILLGGTNTMLPVGEKIDEGLTVNDFDAFPLPEIWKQWMTDNDVDPFTLLRLDFAATVSNLGRMEASNFEEWAAELLNTHLNTSDCYNGLKDFAAKPYSALTRDVLAKLKLTVPSTVKVEICVSLMADLLKAIPEEKWTEKIKELRGYRPKDNLLLTDLSPLRYFNSNSDYVDEETLVKRAGMCYELGRISGMQFIGMDETDIAACVTQGIVDVNDLYRSFFRQNPTGDMQKYTPHHPHKRNADVMKRYPVLREVAITVAQRVIDIEVLRGDTPTEVSNMAASIKGHTGVKNFTNILVALGNETLVRGYIYSSTNAKKEVLSSLLRASRPAEDDNAKTLKEALQGRIEDKRLLEAAMYSPSWISIIEEYLGWKGLKSAAWYFHAHTNESVSAEFETEVARYSPIERNEFQDGAFDISWFTSAYKELGKKRFDVLYDCAKYISSGSTHRRAQLFSDAALGRLKVKDLEKEIADKRNKDKLLSYSLVPLNRKNREKDALSRYEFIQKFLKESKQFGSQRQASEGKAAAIALDNLARNLGFSDSLRFSWKMEILKLDELRQYFAPAQVEEWTAYVDAAEVELILEKDGKRLKTLPAKLKKNAYIDELKKIKTDLKAQMRRARTSLEKAMESQDVFTMGEVSDLLQHPVIGPMVEKLVFLQGTEANEGSVLGFLAKDGLIDYDGKLHAVGRDEELTIAHCYQLYMSGRWLNYQRYVFEQQIQQPFKQIFRELYLINEDEQKERTISRRYAGHQIQPKKTVALLKGRRWTVDYDSGLQKVYYKENLIATMYALADWFSPSEVEAPTLETVEFRDRKTSKAVPFDEVQPVIFSEIMRDVDLVVSVAHVGGVDPEASHSTIEMRRVIIAEAARMMNLENVSIEGSLAKIKGHWGEYSVHLGSAMIQMLGKGSLNILPVHSQHRGRIFLPFLDEDPKTAEILSKILLLAEDNKIKDPTIMSQITGR